MRFIPAIVVVWALSGWSLPGLCQTLEPKSPQAQEVKDLVERAAALINKKGRFAFDEFRVKGGHWFRGDSYLFVDTTDAVVLCYPPNVSLEGSDVLEMKDKAGNEFHREMQR